MCFCVIFILNSVDEKVIKQAYNNEESQSTLSDVKRLSSCLNPAESDKFEVLQVRLVFKCNFA
jgi:hypothetical protein